MKICEFEKINEMLNARSVFLEILSSAEDLTPRGEVTTDNHGDDETVRPEAMEHLRMMITESIRLVERDLLAAGIEIDEVVIKGGDTDDFVDQTYGRFRHLENRIIKG